MYSFSIIREVRRFLQLPTFLKSINKDSITGSESQKMRATDLKVSLARQTPGFPWIRGASFWRFAHVKVAHKRSKIQGSPGVCPAKETLTSVAHIFGFLNLLLSLFYAF